MPSRPVGGAAAGVAGASVTGAAASVAPWLGVGCGGVAGGLGWT